MKNGCDDGDVKVVMDKIYNDDGRFVLSKTSDDLSSIDSKKRAKSPRRNGIGGTQESQSVTS